MLRRLRIPPVWSDTQQKRALAKLGLTTPRINYNAVTRVWLGLIAVNHLLPQKHKLIKRVGTGLPRPLQADALRKQVDWKYSALKALRQYFGKTTNCAVIRTTELLAGLNTFTALPTLKQGTRIPLERVKAYMSVLTPKFGIRRERPFNELSIRWNNGGQLDVFSFSETGIEGSEGGTYDSGWIDEGHRMLAEHLAYFTALLNRAMLAGDGRLMVTGVWTRGENKLLSRAVLDKDERFAGRVIEVTASMVADEDDALRAAGSPIVAGQEELREVLRVEEQNADPGYWQEFYSGPDLTAVGARKFYDEVPAERPANERVAGEPDYFAGVDVGKVQHHSVVSVLRAHAGIVNVCAIYILPLGVGYPEQARSMLAWLYGQHRQLGEQFEELEISPGVSVLKQPEPLGLTLRQLRPYNVFVEVPGPGIDLCDIFRDPANPLLPQVTDIAASDDSLPVWTRSLKEAMRRPAYLANTSRPCFGVCELPILYAGGRTTVRGHMNALQVNVKVTKQGNLITEPEHSDVNSSVLTAWGGMMQRVGAL